MSHWLLGLVTPWDPLHNDGYQFWSGIGSGSPLLVGAYVLLRKHNCHSKGCWRLGRHHVDGTPYIVCRRHHPEDKPSQELIHSRWRAHRKEHHEHTSN